MPNKAIHQLPPVTDSDATDVFHIVRDVGGNLVDRKIARSLVSQTIYTYDTVIESADVLTLYTTPVQIVPVPAAGKIILPLVVLVTETGGTTDYSSGSILIGSQSTLSDTVYTVTVVAPGTTGGYPKVFGFPTTSLGGAAAIAEEALYAKVFTADPTTGDRDWVFRTYYQLLDA